VSFDASQQINASECTKDAITTAMHHVSKHEIENCLGKQFATM